MANTQLTRTFTAGNRKTYTISLWLKRSGIGSSPNYQAVFLASGGDDGIFFKNDNTLDCFFHGVEKRTNRVFRDTNAWYHIMVAVDTTQSTASNRLKIYVNGEQETSFAYNSGDPAQDSQNLFNNSGGVNRIGNHSSSSYQFDGLMSHIHYCDGTALAPTVFGSTDSTTGEWKINTAPSFTPGTNGFTILKDGNTITDQSANSNNFTLASGTLTKTEDCPSNVFATWNPLDNSYASSTFNSGNTGLNSGGSGIETWNTSTLGASSGKYYFELKHNGGSGTPYRQLVGITQSPTTSASAQLGSTSTSWGYYDNTGNVRNNNSNISWSGNTWTQNDIIGVAMDLDNNRLFFSKNGTWQNSADPTTNTGAITITDGTYFFAWGDATGNSNYCNANFGNGYFGTTAVSSAGTNASGNGIFEYNVPTGYTALSTKGLNE